MPKIYTYMGIVILFYSNEHDPVHVHGKFQGAESRAEFELADGEVVSITISSVAGRRPLEPQKLAEFETFVEAYSSEIVEKWIDYFIRHRRVSCEDITRRIR